MGYFDSVTLPDGTVLHASINHIDIWDERGQYGVRMYKHPDGHYCTRDGAPIRLPDGKYNWEAFKRTEHTKGDIESAMEIIKEYFPKKEQA
jgi:hypothetical protein